MDPTNTTPSSSVPPSSSEEPFSPSQPSPPVSKQWLVARNAIDNFDQPQLDAFDVVLSTFSEAERIGFLEWYFEISLAESNANEALERKELALTMKQYVGSIKSIDFLDDDSIWTFLSSFSIISSKPSANPILLGSVGTVQYFLRPQSTFLEPRNDLEASVKLHPFIFRFKSENGRNGLPLHYGIHIGVMEYAAMGVALNHQSKRTKTPFDVFLNPEDRSIWLVLDRHPHDNLGDPVPVREDTDGWRFLPTPRGSAPPMDVICIFTGLEISQSDGYEKGNGLGGHRAIFTAKQMASAQMKALVPYCASQDEVTRAMGKAWSRQSAPPTS